MCTMEIISKRLDQIECGYVGIVGFPFGRVLTSRGGVNTVTCGTTSSEYGNYHRYTTCSIQYKISSPRDNLPPTDNQWPCALFEFEGGAVGRLDAEGANYERLLRR